MCPPVSICSRNRRGIMPSLDDLGHNEFELLARIAHAVARTD